MALFAKKKSKGGIGQFRSDSVCKLCGKRFTSDFCQKLHENVHKINGIKCERSMKRCVICNKSFERENVYKFHKQQFHKKPGHSEDVAMTVVFPSWYVTKKTSQVSNGNAKLNGKVLNNDKKPSKDLIGEFLMDRCIN